jgi:hypothetical protein
MLLLTIEELVEQIERGDVEFDGRRFAIDKSGKKVGIFEIRRSADEGGHVMMESLGPFPIYNVKEDADSLNATTIYEIKVMVMFMVLGPIYCTTPDGKQISGIFNAIKHCEELEELAQ